ncbi:MAG: FAD-binding oxidoreductase [Gammaproteobacteria bacterium]|nr:FAD-binding oxidoreductase [Gammaproteobacteria bacterium]
MDLIRRNLLLGGAAIAAVPKVLMAATSRLSVGVVGGGIVGASIAMHLAQAGADVTVFEKTAPASGATGDSFAWLNAYSDNAHYRNFRLRSIAAYHELDQQLQLDITWGGYLNWESDPEVVARLRDQAERFSNGGYPLRLLSSTDFAAIAPNVLPGPFEVAVYGEMDGHLDPVGVTRKFLAQAEKHGARVIYPCAVDEIELSGNRLSGVSTSRGSFSFDRLVIASGVDVPVLSSQLGYRPPLVHSPGILAHSVPARPMIGTVNYGSGLHFKQLKSGVIVAADSAYAPDTPIHYDIRHERLDFPSDDIRDMHGLRILDKISTVLPDSRGTALDHLTLGFRPLPKDDFPIVGFVPDRTDIYVAVMHSGVTLAPIVGQSISREILDGISVDLLSPYRPERFA